MDFLCVIFSAIFMLPSCRFSLLSAPIISNRLIFGTCKYNTDILYLQFHLSIFGIFILVFSIFWFALFPSAAAALRKRAGGTFLAEVPSAVLREGANPAKGWLGTATKRAARVSTAV